MNSTSQADPRAKPKVVIVGGGFGGLRAAMRLRRAPVEVTLIDRRNFHLFQPLLYQVATGALSPANIAAPLRSLLKNQKNARVLLAEARQFDLDQRRVILDYGSEEYDYLIVAAGSSHSYFGHPEWERFAPGLKSIEDATLIRRRLLGAFEAAERLPAGPERDAWLSFVVVGAGPTGVELVGQIAEIASHTLRNDYRSIRPTDARVYLLDMAPRALNGYPEPLSEKTHQALRDLGVQLITGARVTNVDERGVEYNADGVTARIAARTVLWAAGVEASPLARSLAEQCGAEIDRSGRIVVGSDLSLPGRPEVFVIGDMAHCKGEDGQPLPAVAPVAMQQGRYVANLIWARLQGKTLEPFRYRDMGSMATIGRMQAVADLRFIRFSGFPAWLVWLFVHLMGLVQHQSRVLVLIQWAWHFITRNRSARLITNTWPPGAERELEHAEQAKTESESDAMSAPHEMR